MVVEKEIKKAGVSQPRPAAKTIRSIALSHFTFHHQIGRSKPGSFEEQVEVCPFEHQFGHVVELGIFKQAHWSNCWKRILSGQWFLVVVEVDYVGFPEA